MAGCNTGGTASVAAAEEITSLPVAQQMLINNSSELCTFTVVTMVKMFVVKALLIVYAIILMVIIAPHISSKILLHDIYLYTHTYISIVVKENITISR